MFLIVIDTGAQLGIFEGRSPIHERALQNFLIEDTACENVFSDS